jgi:hypothetical protein
MVEEATCIEEGLNGQRMVSIKGNMKEKKKGSFWYAIFWYL